MMLSFATLDVFTKQGGKPASASVGGPAVVVTEGTIEA